MNNGVQRAVKSACTWAFDYGGSNGVTESEEASLDARIRGCSRLRLEDPLVGSIETIVY